MSINKHTHKVLKNILICISSSRVLTKSAIGEKNHRSSPSLNIQCLKLNIHVLYMHINKVSVFW